MKISDLLSPTDVMIDVRATSKRALLQEYGARAATNLGLPVDQVAPLLLKREDLGSTGIGKGVAIPHVRLPDVPRPYGLLARLRQPIEFDAIDGQAVDIVFVLLLPANAESAQLGALALVARTLRPPENLVRLRSAKTASELYAAIADQRRCMERDVNSPSAPVPWSDASSSALGGARMAVARWMGSASPRRGPSGFASARPSG